MDDNFRLIDWHFDNAINIYPISDVHLGAMEHKEKEWADFCDGILTTPDSYIVLAGDLINNCTRSSVSNIWQEKMFPHQQKKRMVEMLTPIRDRILCSVTGNHERRSVKDADDNPTYDIMAKLDLEHLYRENMAFLRIRMGRMEGDGRTNPTYILGVTHGAGGGGMTGSAVNRAEKFGYILDGVDALVLGHTHKPFVTQPAKLVVDSHNGIISMKPFKVVSATSWLDYGGYAMEKMLAPSSFAPQIMHLSRKHKEILVTM